MAVFSAAIIISLVIHNPAHIFAVRTLHLVDIADEWIHRVLFARSCHLLSSALISYAPRWPLVTHARLRLQNIYTIIPFIPHRHQPNVLNECTRTTTNNCWRSGIHPISSDGVETLFLRQRQWPRQRYRDMRRAETFRIWSRRDETET